MGLDLEDKKSQAWQGLKKEFCKQRSGVQEVSHSMFECVGEMKLERGRHYQVYFEI